MLLLAIFCYLLGAAADPTTISGALMVPNATVAPAVAVVPADPTIAPVVAISGAPDIVTGASVAAAAVVAADPDLVTVVDPADSTVDPGTTVVVSADPDLVTVKKTSVENATIEVVTTSSTEGPLLPFFFLPLVPAVAVKNGTEEPVTVIQVLEETRTTPAVVILDAATAPNDEETDPDHPNIGTILSETNGTSDTDADGNLILKKSQNNNTTAEPKAYSGTQIAMIVICAVAGVLVVIGIGFIIFWAIAKRKNANADGAEAPLLVSSTHTKSSRKSAMSQKSVSSSSAEQV